MSSGRVPFVTFLSKSEKLVDLISLEAGADYYDHAVCFCLCSSDFAFTRYVVELEPAAFGVLYDALSSEYFTAFVKAVNDFLEFCSGVLIACMCSDLIEDLISIMSVVVMMVVVMMMFMLVVIVVIIVVVMVMVVVMFVLVVIVVIIVVMMMVVMMLVLVVIVVIIVVVMMMVMMVAVALFIITLVLMLVSCELFVCLFSQLVKFCAESLLGLHNLEHLGTAQLIPVSCYYLSLRVKFSDRLDYSVDFLTAESLLM